VKILDITEFYSERGGGVRSHLTTRGHVLCQLGHDHVVIAPGPRDEESVLNASSAPTRNATSAPARRDGVEAHGHPRVALHAPRDRLLRVAGPSLPYDRTYHLLGRFGKIRSLVRAYGPDVLEAHSPYLATAAILACGRAAARVRTAFWHADHVGTYVRPALAKRLGEPAADALARPLWRGVRALLAPFDATFVAGVAQEARLRAAGVRNVVRAPFGVDTRTFSPAARRNERRRELVAGEEGPLLLGVGRFAIEKRWDVVLAAFGRVRARHGGTLVLFGDGPERERLRATAPAGVRFAGFETDRVRLASALASADVLVHGCPYETFGIGVAEAVACGLPVVAPDTGGAAESVDPSCGETYRSLDAHACAQAIERLLARDPVDLRQRAIRAASRVPTLEQHFAVVLATYDDLLRAC
jgi:alpha-1,6-mannosyltransferase